MNIRNIESGDLPELKKIWEQGFKQEFAFPDFLHGFYCSFLAEDENGIISAGGVRPIAESVLVTDLSREPLVRKQALVNMLQASIFTSDRNGFNELHAFIQDDRWMRRLLRSGFRPTVGRALVLHW